MKKRLLSLLLAGGLILSLFPAKMIFAEQQQQGTYRYQIDQENKYDPVAYRDYAVFNPELAEETELMQDIFSARYYRKGISANKLYSQYIGNYNDAKTMPVRIHAESAARYRLGRKYIQADPFQKGDMQLGFIMRCENDLEHRSMKHGLDSVQDSWGLFRLFGTDYSAEALGSSVMSLGFANEKTRAVHWEPYKYHHMAMFQMADFRPSDNAFYKFLGVKSKGSCPWGDVNFDDVSALLMDAGGPRLQSVTVSKYPNLLDARDDFGFAGPKTEFGAGEVAYIHLQFDEPVRFCDNLPEKDKVLLIKRKSAETMTEMGKPLEATFWRLNNDQNDMVFRFRVPDQSSEPFCFAADSLEPWSKQTYLYGKDANNVGKFQDDNPIFDFVSTAEKKEALMKKYHVESAIVDIAGNPVRNVGIPFFEKAVFDNTKPHIEYCDVDVTRAEQNSADPSKVYVREGDTVRLTAVFNKRIGMKFVKDFGSFYKPGDVLDVTEFRGLTHKAVLNILNENGKPAEAKFVSVSDGPASVRDNRIVTQLTFEYKIQKNDHLDGERIAVSEIRMDEASGFKTTNYTYCDRCGNGFEGDKDGHVIRPSSEILSRQQYFLDNDGPVVTNTEKSKSEEKLFFVNKLTVSDSSGSGTLGATGDVVVSALYRGNAHDQKLRWALKSAQDGPPAEEEYIEGNITNHPFSIPLFGEEMNLYVYLSGTSSVDKVDISFQARDRVGNLSPTAKTSCTLGRAIDLSGPEIVSMNREISGTGEKKQHLIVMAEDPSGIMTFEYQFGETVRENGWIGLTEGLAPRPDSYRAVIEIPSAAPGKQTETIWIRMQDAQGIQSSVQQYVLDVVNSDVAVNVRIDADPMSLSQVRAGYKIDSVFQNTTTGYYYWTYVDAAGNERPLADYAAEQNARPGDCDWVSGIVIPSDWDSHYGFPGYNNPVYKLMDDLEAACGTNQKNYRRINQPESGTTLKLGTDRDGTVNKLQGKFALHLTVYEMPKITDDFGQATGNSDVYVINRKFVMNMLGDEAEKSLGCEIYNQYDNRGSLSQTIADSSRAEMNMEDDASHYTAELRITSPFAGISMSQILDAQRSTVRLVDLKTGAEVQKVPVEAVDTQMLRFQLEPGKAYKLQPEFYILGSRKPTAIQTFSGMGDVIQISDLEPRLSGVTGCTVHEDDPNSGSSVTENPLGDGNTLYSTIAVGKEKLPTTVDPANSFYLNMKVQTETERTDDAIPYGFVKIWSDYTARLKNEVQFTDGAMHDTVGTQEAPFIMSTNELGYGNLVDQPSGNTAALGDQKILIPVFYAQAMTDEEVVRTGMDYGNRALPLLDGRNNFCYQIVLSNGKESEVRTFDVLVDGMAPQASVHMKPGTAPDSQGGEGKIKTMKPVIDYVLDNVSRFSEMKITETGYDAAGNSLPPNDPAVNTQAEGYSILNQGSGYLFTAPGKYVLTVADAAGNIFTAEKVMTDADFDSQIPDIAVQVDPAPQKGDVEFTVSVSDNCVKSGEVPFTLTFNPEYMAQLGRSEIFPMNDAANNEAVSFPGLVSLKRIREGEYHVVMDACYNPDGADSNLKSLIFQAEDPSGNVARKEVAVTVSNEKPAVVKHYYSAAEGYTLEFNKTVRLGEQTMQPYRYGRKISGVAVAENGNYDVELIDLFANVYHETIQAELYPVEYAHKMTVSERKATNQNVTVTIDTAENPDLTVSVKPSDAIEIVKTSATVTTVTVKENTKLVYTLSVSGLGDLERILPITNIDKVSPTAQVEYIYEEPVVNGKTDGYVTAVLTNLSEPVTVTSNSGSTHLFMENGKYTFTFEDAAGNRGSAVASVDAKISKKQVPQDSTAPGYSLRIYSFNEEGYSKIGSFNNENYRPEELEKYSPVHGKLVLEFVPDDVNPVTVTVQESGKPVVVEDYRIFVSENCVFHADLTDSGKNRTTLEVRVCNIDNEAPTASVRYEEASGGSVKAYLNLKDNLTRPENIEILNRDGITTDSSGTYYTFRKNGSVMIRFRDEAGNVGTLPVQVHFLDETKPATELKKWVPCGEKGDTQPPTAPTNRDVLAFFNFNKNIKTITLTDTDGSPADSTAVTFSTNGKTATVRFRQNYQATVLTFTDFSGNRDTYNLPAINIIDKEPLTVLSAVKNEEQPKPDEVVYTVTLSKQAYLTSAYGKNDELTAVHTLTFPANGTYTMTFADQAGNLLSYPIVLKGDSGLADITVPKVTIKAPMTKGEYDAYIAGGEKLNAYKTVTSTEAEITADETVFVRIDNIFIKKILANEKLIVPVDRNGVFKVSVTDEAGNCFLTEFEIDCIDRDAPVITSRDGGVLVLPVGTSESDFQAKVMEGMKAMDEREGDLTGQMTIQKSAGFNLQKTGIYSVLYHVSDSLGNEETYSRKIQITQGQGLAVYVNGQGVIEGDVKALPRGVRSVEITTSLDGTVPMKMLCKPGIQTKGTMKSDSVKFDKTLSALSAGYYTVLVQTQDRENIMIYLYFSF